MRREIWVLIVVVVLVAAAAFFVRPKAQAQPLLEKRVIRTRVVDMNVAFEERDYWTDYGAIGDREAFSEALVSNFTATFSDYGLQVLEPEVTFDDLNGTTTFRCVIKGAVTKVGDKYYARFEWLLRPLGLDFIDDHFEESEYGLSWEGYAKGVWTEITCEFPYTGMVYEAWGEPVGHCHAHVWWKS